MSETAEQPEAQQRQLPPLKETRWVNVNIAIGDPDADGTRELSFVTGITIQGAPELTTFVLSADAQKYLVEQFSGGITVAQPGDVPPLPPDQG